MTYYVIDDTSQENKNYLFDDYTSFMLPRNVSKDWYLRGNKIYKLPITGRLFYGIGLSYITYSIFKTKYENVYLTAKEMLGSRKPYYLFISIEYKDKSLLEVAKIFEETTCTSTIDAEESSSEIGSTEKVRERVGNKVFIDYIIV